MALGNTEGESDVTKTHFRVVGNAEERSAVIAEEPPIGHPLKISESSGNRLPVTADGMGMDPSPDRELGRVPPSPGSDSIVGPGPRSEPGGIVTRLLPSNWIG
jgi:hypothetical protein